VDLGIVLANWELALLLISWGVFGVLWTRKRIDWQHKRFSNQVNCVQSQEKRVRPKRAAIRATDRRRMDFNQDLTGFRFWCSYLSDIQNVRRSIAFVNNCFHYVS